jgi:uncharacterized protein (DUF4415 family)
MPTGNRTTRMTLEQARAAAAVMPPLPTVSDEEIERRAHADPDAPLATDEQLLGATREYPHGATDRRPKQLVSLRIDPAVLEAYRATGAGWQRRMHDVLAAGVPRSSPAAPMAAPAAATSAEVRRLHQRVLVIERQLEITKASPGGRRPQTIRTAVWSGGAGDMPRVTVKGGGRSTGAKRTTLTVAKTRAKSPAGETRPAKGPREP